MKKLVKSIVNKLGIDIVKYPHKFDQSEIFEKYSQTITELQIVYHNTFLKEIPLQNPKRIELMTQLLGTNPSEALYILNALHKSINLEGDVCEFGIAQGATSALLANEIYGTNKNLWLFDSFKGLPKPTEKDKLKDDIFNLQTMEAYEGTMAYDVSYVTQKLNGINFPMNRVKFIPGFIEETINRTDLPKKVCFGYIDFDFYEPILIALNYLKNTLSSGGYLVVDDYNWFSTGAQTAVDEFLKENEQMFEFSLPLEGVGHFCLLKKK